MTEKEIVILILILLLGLIALASSLAWVLASARADRAVETEMKTTALLYAFMDYMSLHNLPLPSSENSPFMEACNTYYRNIKQKRSA